MGVGGGWRAWWRSARRWWTASKTEKKMAEPSEMYTARCGMPAVKPRSPSCQPLARQRVADGPGGDDKCD